MPIDGERILLTGGTGSFAHKFVERALTRHKPHRLIIYSRDEAKQYEMAQRFRPADHPALRYFIGDVRDSSRLEMAMRGINIVIHAAALKHVPVAEYNPFECIKTNVHGAENVVTAAIRSNVKKVVALSTDKAVNPINLYGASKLASDKIFVAANSLAGSKGCRFAIVRYGNVVGSRGSVVPFYQKLIREGAKSLPITDPRMTRFWISLDQGVDLVMSSLDRMQGGEVFIPKIPSMRITDLATAMAPHLEHQIIGIRPGEKLHEALLGEDDARSTVEFDNHYVLEPAMASWDRKSSIELGGKPVLEGFQYVSNTNTQWINGEQIQDMLKNFK